MNIYNSLVTVIGKIIQNAPDLDLDEFDVKDLPIIAPVLPDIMKLLDKILGLEEGTIENECTLDQLVSLIVLELQINNIEEIRQNFTKAKAIWNPKNNKAKKK